MDVDEVEAVRPALEQWRRDISKPLSVQIFLQHTTPPATSSSPSATRTTKKQGTADGGGAWCMQSVVLHHPHHPIIPSPNQ